MRDPDGFERDTALSRRLGYRGRTLIHPAQIEPCNRLYRPSEAELDYYARVLEAFDQAQPRSVLRSPSCAPPKVSDTARGVAIDMS